MGPLQGLKTVGDTISEMAVSSWPGSGHDCADIDRTSPTGRWWWSLYWLVVAQLPSHFQLFAIPRTATHQASLSFTISTSLLKFMSIESVMLSSHLILCCPLLLQSFPALGFFPNELALCIRWPKYWSFSISPSNEYSGLISFRIDWFDLLAVLKVECSGLWSSGKVPCGWAGAVVGDC